uniref:Uncharacterized protein n=1 Tax=Arundo donax TaxID=35708 RepID=A0A0A9FZF7_ARUDO
MPVIFDGSSYKRNAS